MTLESLNCPNCSAPLPDPAGRSSITCSHCQTIVRVAPAAAASDEPISAPPNHWAVDVKTFTADDLAQVKSHLERGNKIGAIKHYRERTGTGLKEAKDAVEAIERGREPPVVAMARAMHNVPAGVDLAQIQALLKAGNKIEAIRLYRNTSGLSLKESKQAVEAIAASTPGVKPSLGPTESAGCWNVLLIIAVVVMCLFGGCGTVAQTTATYRCVMPEVKNDLRASGLLGQEVNAGYVVLAPSYNQSLDLDGSWALSMNLFMPAWGSRGLGWLYVSASANDTGYTVMRSTLFADWERHVLETGRPVECR
jgi:LSD1 subclass zinc finger protein